MPITVNATSATFLMALAFVAGLTWLSRREALPLWLIAIVAVPIGLLHLDTDWRLFSVHGLMHASMVYEIFERGLPAETPLVAGTPLQYPYGVHVLVAGILRVMPISPPTVFAMLNIGCLIGSIVVFDRIARAVSPDRAYRWLALILVMFGVTVFSGGPFGNLIFSSALEEHRWPLDILFKFITTNNNQLGILLYGIAMLGLIQLIKGCGNSIRNFATIGGGFVLAGLLYPFAWLAIGVAGGVTIVQLGVTHDSVKRRQALYVLGLFAVCTVLVLPWLLSLTGDKAPRGTMGLHPDQIAFAIGLLFIAMAGPLVLALWRRGEVTRLFQEHRETAIFFLGITAILQALFLGWCRKVGGKLENWRKLRIVKHSERRCAAAERSLRHETSYGIDVAQSIFR